MTWPWSTWERRMSRTSWQVDRILHPTRGLVIRLTVLFNDVRPWQFWKARYVWLEMDRKQARQLGDAIRGHLAVPNE